ncbi:ataxin 1-like S homeolog [Xenopus laevis]|uniref:Ataxin 1-like S homeolog n=2 Tax=Xenopus laevis TaxID=8355 RepID=B1WBC1_XENLA|nr:ataxin 1-like S homeolog [Xenopus laevis]AAI61700.1 LOC100158423 protein [Xenopus laevis]OCT82371.1 hypothetical protein XELAEV_18024898mg [Xenopus laevis]
MKPAHERSQECLPPKKRDLAQNSVTVEEEPKIPSSSANESTTSEASGWQRSVFMAAGQGQGVGYAGTGEGAEAVTVDQYATFYKVAVPAASFSPPGLHQVMNMSSIPSSFSVASPLIQHQGITYPPIHYAQIPHTAVQFLGSPYAVPYTVPPGFLSRAVISPPTNLAAPHVPHYVPYNSVLVEGVTPPPEAQSPHSMSKLTNASSPSVLMGVVPVDVAKGRVPLFYQHSSQLPVAYPVNEMLLACHSNTELCAPSHAEKDRDMLITSTNGTQRVPDNVSGHRSSKVVDIYIHNAEEQLGKVQENMVDGDVYTTQRTEASLLTHRSTPDTDLEVQRVVGGLASRDFCSQSVQKKDMLIPLNLSQNATEQRVQPKRDSVYGKLPSPSPERGQITMYIEQPVKYTEKVTLTANGEPTKVKNCPTQQSFPARPLSKLQGAPNRHTCDTPSDRNSPHTNVESKQPPHSAALPSHFMKGAIIQLATGELKRVEDLQTQDFVRSAEASGGLKVDSSTVVDIQESQWPGFVTLHFFVGEQQSKVCLDVPPEHPFFVYGQGWSSCSPRQTTQLFALPCHRLQVGDVCISISLQSAVKNDASTVSCTSASQTTPKTTEKAVLYSREGQLLEIDGETHNQLKKKGQSSFVQTLCSQPSAVSSWSSSGVQRHNVQNADTQPSRHSFIPQEVKLSIEGRSNAGK